MGNVVLVEVFQVNCPGCFTNGIPQAIDLHIKYYHDGLRVLGVATAFEDFDKNTLDNLKLLLTSGEVIGETRKVLGEYGRLRPGNNLTYKIPFQIGMDTLLKFGPLTHDKVMEFIEAEFSRFQILYRKGKGVDVRAGKTVSKTKTIFSKDF